MHGDPCVARDMLEICEYIDSVSSNTAVRVNTNGGMRKADWWGTLGKLFAKHPITTRNYWEVTFSIDGLEDTNHLYRRNVNWGILMENVDAFIKAGGNARWDYLIFKHNEHQIHEANTLSNTMGFTDFVPKKSLGVDNGTNLKAMPALTKDGELDYIIEAPTDPKNRNLENPAGTEPLVFWKFNPEDYRKDKAEKNVGKNFQAEVKTVYEDRILKEDNTKYNNCKIICKSKMKKLKG